MYVRHHSLRTSPWLIQFSNKINLIPVSKLMWLLCIPTRIDRPQVWIGLGTSIILMVVCVPYLTISTEIKPRVDGAGLLHHIWLCRNHPQFQEFLKPIKVDHPTEFNLRIAGSATVNLCGGKSLTTELHSSCKAEVNQGHQNQHPYNSTGTLLNGYYGPVAWELLA